MDILGALGSICEFLGGALGANPEPGKLVLTARPWAKNCAAPSLNFPFRPAAGMAVKLVTQEVLGLPGGEWAWKTSLSYCVHCPSKLCLYGTDITSKG